MAPARGTAGSDVEAERAQLLAAVLGDLVRSPRRQPDPVDPEVADQPVERGLGLILDDIPERLEHVLDLGAGARRVELGFMCLRHRCSHLVSVSAWAVASFHAIQPSSAHLIRAGYLATPAKTTASPSASSSGSAASRECISSRNFAPISIASLTGLPISRSVSTETLAWLIEQPSASYDTSATAGSPSASFRVTRRVTSSPQVGLT